MKAVLINNGLEDGHYVEVYAGGAGIAWPLLFEEVVRVVHINDINRSIHAFWHCVLYDTESLCRMIRDTKVSLGQWQRQRQILDYPDDRSMLELGFSSFFLNRTNRSGILTGGIIGGKSQTGRWRMNARFNKSDLITRIQRIARYASRVRLYNMDAALIIKDVLPSLPRKTLVYLDPPYYEKGKDLYEDHYHHNDHVLVSKLVTGRIGQAWIVSYDAAPSILELYGQHRSIRYCLSYSAQERYSGSEVMFFSSGLVLPLVDNPIHM